MLARKIIKNEALGLKQDKPEHKNYVVIMPVIIAMLFSFAVVRFNKLALTNAIETPYSDPYHWGEYKLTGKM